MAKYDPRIIEHYADGLYVQALFIIVTHTIVGTGIGLGLGWVLAQMPTTNFHTSGYGIGASIGGVLGFIEGQGKAFWLKLQAQVALCQVQIEKNTRLAQQESSAKVDIAGSVSAITEQSVILDDEDHGWTCCCGHHNAEGTACCEQCNLPMSITATRYKFGVDTWRDEPPSPF